MGRARVRLKDIAQQTGFSTNTVSLALRDSPRIPEETRKLIRETADKLNYLPNQIAKSLVSQETHTIGLVLTDIRNPTLNQAAQAIELALADQGYATLFATSDNTLAKEIETIKLFRSRQVDGILIYPSSHRDVDHIRALRQSGYPIVQLASYPDGGVDCVAVDDFAGAYKATRHLLELGHRRIGFLDAAQAIGNATKLEGYKKALAEFDAAFDSTLSYDPNGHSAAQGFDGTAVLMDRADPPTAIFCTNDSLALGVIRWAVVNGVPVPEKLAVAGFDNIELGAYAAMSLTTVNYDAQAVSRLAVSRLLALIAAGDQLPPPQVKLIEPELVTRESTAG